MISDVLKQSIEKHAQDSLTTNPIFVLAEAGKLSPAQVSFYLSSILELIRHTPIFLKLASEVSAQRGDASLEKFFLHKYDEEFGHEEWAKSDIQQVKSSAGEMDARVSSSISNLLGYLRSRIHEDPYLYLPYIYLAEYFTVLVGPVLVSAVEGKCNLPNGSMTVVSNHAELDKEHVTEWIEFFDRQVPREYVDSFLKVIDEAMKFYAGFGEEVGNASSVQ